MCKALQSQQFSSQYNVPRWERAESRKIFIWNFRTENKNVSGRALFGLFYRSFECIDVLGYCNIKNK